MCLILDLPKNFMSVFEFFRMAKRDQAGFGPLEFYW